MTQPAAPRVLVVEDDQHIHQLLVTLMRDEGYAVVEAWDGAEACAMIDQHRAPDAPLAVVLLDMMLPDMDGLQVLQHLRAQGTDVPTVALSASTTLLAEAMRMGARVAVAKPFEIEAIIALVGSYCEVAHD